MAYATIADIQARLSFTLNVNSVPTLLNAGIIHDNVTRFIDEYIGRSIAGGDQGLKWAETQIVVAQIMAIHRNDMPPMYLTWETKNVLDNKRAKDNVKVYNLEFGYDSSI